jgi:hypothetical protein
LLLLTFGGANLHELLLEETLLLYHLDNGRISYVFD